MHGLIEHLVDRLAIVEAAQFVQDINIDPAFSLAGDNVGVIVRRQVLKVLGLTVQLIASDITFRIGVGNHAARLGKELPGLRLDKHQGFLATNMIGDRSLASHDRPPMIFVGRVGVSDNAIPGRATILHRRKTAHAHRTCIDNLLRDLACFVDPHAG